MPVKSKAQFRLFKAAENNPKVAKKLGMSQSKAAEMTEANVGKKSYGKLPKKMALGGAMPPDEHTMNNFGLSDDQYRRINESSPGAQTSYSAPKPVSMPKPMPKPVPTIKPAPKVVETIARPAPKAKPYVEYVTPKKMYGFGSSMPTKTTSLKPTPYGKALGRKSGGAATVKMVTAQKSKKSNSCW